MNEMDKIGGFLPAPEQSMIYKGHYKSLLNITNERRLKRKETSIENLMNFGNKNTKQCKYCKYILTSLAEAKRHYLFMEHEGKPDIEVR